MFPAPASDALDTAPLIRDWYALPMAGGGRCLSGVIIGHPDYPAVVIGSTERVVEHGEGWCRTERRLYRVGARRGLRCAPIPELPPSRYTAEDYRC